MGRAASLSQSEFFGFASHLQDSALLNFCPRYSSLLRLAEGKLETVMASNKDENHPPEVPGDSLGEEARNRNGCVGLDPEHNSSTGDKTVKPEKLLGEKVQQQIERVVLDAAHNVCVEENTTAESRGQDCGVLEAKVSLLHNHMKSTQRSPNLKSLNKSFLLC